MPTPLSIRIRQAGRVLLDLPISRRLPGEISGISAEEVQEARQFFPLQKFFIFGHARAGTTVYTRLVRLHPEVHCNYQAHFFTRLPLLQSLVADPEVQAWLSRGSNRWNRGGDLSPVVMRAAADMILEREARRENKRIVGDKSPNSLLDGKAVVFMHKIYPDARLIYIIRDGRDTVLSHRFQAFIEFPERLAPEDQRLRTAFSLQPAPFLCGERSLFTERSLVNAVEGWVRNVVQTNQLGQELYGDRYLVSRYEDLLTRPFEEMSRLWAFLEASLPTAELERKVVDEMHSNPDAEWQQQKAGDIASIIPKGRQGSWQVIFTERDKKIFHQVAGQVLQEWGYEIPTESSRS